MLADELDYVIGVDTHRDQHTLAIVAAATGAVLAQTVVGASARGYADACRFAARHADGVRAWAVEGAGHYGAGLTRFLAAHGERVLEVGRQSHGERRLRGKDDALDAIRAARTGLAADALTLPRAGEHQEAFAGAAFGAPQRRRRTSRRARPVAQPDRDRARTAA
jgi:transposase